LYGRGRIAQLSFFFLRRSFFALRLAGIGNPGGRGHRPRLQNRTNEVDRTNILAPGFWSGSRRTHLLPAFTAPLVRCDWLMESRNQLQQRNCSRFARDFLRRSTFSSSQRTASRSSGLRSALQDLFNRLCPRL